MFAKIRNFFLSSLEELKKVIWPSRKELINHTIIVIISVVVSMAILVAVDLALSAGVQWLIYQH